MIFFDEKRKKKKKKKEEEEQKKKKGRVVESDMYRISRRYLCLDIFRWLSSKRRLCGLNMCLRQGRCCTFSCQCICERGGGGKGLFFFLFS